MIHIGKLTIPTRVLLAPLSACSDLAFRLIAREHGARFCFFEMVDARSLVYQSWRALRMLRTCPEDQPIAAQLLGSDPGAMLKAAQMILERAPVAFLDINAACPARKVFKKGAGACMLNDPAPLYRVLEQMARALPVPVTVKMLVGLHEVDAPRAVAFAKGCEAAGAGALFVHGRARSQENYGPVSYAAIRAVKEAVRIPVIGSGNVLNPPLAKKMLDETGADGVLVAKGSFGNPFIFREIEQYLETGQWQPATDLRLKLQTLKKHLLLFRRIENPAKANWRIGELAKICLWYMKGFAQASRLRGQLFASKSDQDLLDWIDRLMEDPALTPERAA